MDLPYSIYSILSSYLSHFILHEVYEPQQVKWCDSQRDMEYDSMEGAKRACLVENCGMFYDYRSESKTFVLCDTIAKLKPSSVNSTTYIKGNVGLWNPFYSFSMIFILTT